MQRGDSEKIMENLLTHPEWGMDKTPASEIENRIHALQSRLEDLEIDGALIMQTSDLFYFSGTIQQGWLFVPGRGRPVSMVRKNFFRACCESSDPSRIVSTQNPSQIPEILHDHGYAPRSLGLELDVLPVNLFRKLEKIFGAVQYRDISHEIRLIRAVKSAYEIDIVQEAARRGDLLLAHAGESIEEGVPEATVAGRVEAKARELGHQGLLRMRLWGSEIFYGHLMGGPAAALPSFLSSPTGGLGVNAAVAQGSSRRPIHRNEPVIVDYAFPYNGYISDQARIFCLGELPDGLKKAYEAMLEVQETVKTSARPGITGGEVYEKAKALAGKLGYEDCFMGSGPDRVRFIGHGVGLELDEYPFIAEGREMPLENGMVIAVEPKVIQPGKGVVGIENTHVVTDDGLYPLSRFDEGIVFLP